MFFFLSFFGNHFCLWWIQYKYVKDARKENKVKALLKYPNPKYIKQQPSDKQQSNNWQPEQWNQTVKITKNDADINRRMPDYEKFGSFFIWMRNYVCIN